MVVFWWFLDGRKREAEPDGEAVEPTAPDFLSSIGWKKMRHLLPSGKRLHSELENDHRNDVDIPIENGDFPVRYVNVYQRVIRDTEVGMGNGL